MIFWFSWLGELEILSYLVVGDDGLWMFSGFCRFSFVVNGRGDRLVNMVSLDLFRAFPYSYLYILTLLFYLF